jgi:hypothetical protein
MKSKAYFLISLLFQGLPILLLQNCAQNKTRNPNREVSALGSPTSSRNACMTQNLPLERKSHLKEISATFAQLTKASLMGLEKIKLDPYKPHFQARALNIEHYNPENSTHVLIRALEEISTPEAPLRLVMIEPLIASSKVKKNAKIAPFSPLEISSINKGPVHDFYLQPKELNDPKKIKSILERILNCD